VPDPVTVIPSHTKVDGSIETRSDLEIRGRLDGRVEIGGTLTVAAEAVCRASVRARSARILGELIGEVVCSEAIEVAAGARVVGDLRAPDIAVDADAEVDGRIDLLLPAPEVLPRRRVALAMRGGSPARPPVPQRTPSGSSPPEPAEP
jgi:cytoskeletal protein CcmA (bactofilin family)